MIDRDPEAESQPPVLTSPAGSKTGLVMDHVLGLIDDGMSPRDKLPTERELASALGVSRLTVRRAIGQLDTEGRIYRVQGAGTFVADKRITKTLELTGFSEDMRSRGMVPGSSVVEISRLAAGARLSYLLHVPPSSEIVLVHRVRTADGVPMCVENAYFRGDLIPKDLVLGPRDSLYERMATRGADSQPHHAHQSIQATVLTAADAQLLNVPPFSAALVVERTVLNIRNEAIEFARSLYRADRFSFEITVDRVPKSQSNGETYTPGR